MARGRIPTGTSPLCSQMRVLADVTVEVILMGTTPHLVFSFSMSFGIPLCVCSLPTCPDPHTRTLVLVSSLFLSVSLPHHASSMHHQIIGHRSPSALFATPPVRTISDRFSHHHVLPPPLSRALLWPRPRPSPASV